MVGVRYLDVEEIVGGYGMTASVLGNPTSALPRSGANETPQGWHLTAKVVHSAGGRRSDQGRVERRGLTTRGCGR
jgi:hypothetical protein